MAARKKVRINLKRIARPLDSINKRLASIIKKGEEAKKAKKIYEELNEIREELSDICCDNRWFCDV